MLREEILNSSESLLLLIVFRGANARLASNPPALEYVSASGLKRFAQILAVSHPSIEQSRASLELDRPHLHWPGMNRTKLPE